MYPGHDDITGAASLLADELPDELRPLASVAYNYRWSWRPLGPAVFERIDPARWSRCGHNPVRLLSEAPSAALRRAAADSELVADAHALAENAAPAAASSAPVAFMCAEFGVHESLPIYSGGLGILAGDVLKEASDLGGGDGRGRA